jgi:tetratricopeptide (TPR) repeat protein
MKLFLKICLLIVLLFQFSILSGEGNKVEMEIKQLIEQYENCQYKEALLGFEELLTRVKSEEEKVICLQYLSFCYVMLEKNNRAKEEFIKLLKIKPTFTLDPRVVLPEIVRVFQEAQAEYQAQKEVDKKRAFILGFCYAMLEKDKEAKEAFAKLLELEPDFTLEAENVPPEIIEIFLRAKKEHQAKKETSEPQEITKPTLRRSIWLNLLPLGLPQFKAKRTTRGIIFLSTQLLGFGLALWANYEQEKLYQGGFYTDLEKVYRLNAIQRAAFTLGSLSYIGNVIDSFFSKIP